MNAARGGSPDDPSKAFRERARLEADRYGPDPWIFVRELLQNARDAGAGTVRFQVFDREGQSGDAAIICQDNGEGMTFEHARRYLFALYASSKEGKKNQAGKFGVGFWSILRFEPATIIIRSRPREGDPWGISLDGNLDHAMAVEPPTHAGTEIVLRRPRREDTKLEHRIHDAVWQSARYLRQRDNGDAPLEIEVNGRPANAEFALEAPSAAFRRGQVRGVVGLGRSPRVELFSRGLRVRSAACLEDLLSGTGRHSSWMRVQFPELPGGLAPQALLESPDLELMLSRSDARDTRALGKLVRLAQRELERLIERQLEVARPLPWWGRLRQWLGERTRDLSRLRRADAVVLALVVAVLTAVGLRGIGSLPAQEVTVLPVVQQMPLPAATATAAARPRPFQDMGSRYRGPSVGLAADALEPIGLRYKPPEPNHHFAALTFARLAPDGSPVQEVVPRPVGPYASAICGGRLRCIQIDLDLRSAGRAVRIPVPTGHRVVAPSLFIKGQQRPRLRASADGRPVVVLAGPTTGVLRYRTAAMLDPEPPPPPVPPADLPAALGRRARQLRGQPVARRVDTLLDLVRERVAYDDSPATARRHRESLARGEGFLTRVLSIGAGDCDVQNGLLTALLQAAGVPARLAVGYLGDRGGVLPWVHAWVEYFDDRGRWQVADASENAAGGPEIEQLAARTHRQTARPSRVEAGGVRNLPEWDDPVEAFAAADADAALAGPRAPTPPARPSAAAAAPPAAAVAPPAAAVAPPAAAVAPPAARRSPLSGLAIGLGLPLLLAAAGWSLVAARTRRAFKLDGGADLSKLLQGVLQQPGAFAHIHALFHRPIVPLVAGNAVSLRRARDLASRGRLYCTRERPELARGALRAGAAVLDYGLPEGKIVADALGAVDLDAWAKMVASATSNPLLDEVNRLLREEGEEWSVRASVEAKAGLAALDLVPLGAQVPGVQGTRLVVVQDSADWLAEARRYYESRPQAATFMVLDQLALRLNLPRVRRSDLLGASARQAILESFAT